METVTAGRKSNTAATGTPANQTLEENAMTNNSATAKTAHPLRLIALAIFTLVIAATASAQTMFIGYVPSASNPQVQMGISGGTRDAAREIGYDLFGNLCTGYIYHSPDHVIRLPTSQPLMTLEVESFEDTTLVIYHRETGTYICDDDSGLGLDAQATYYDWPAGTYEVYVGSFWYDEYWNYALYVYR